MRERANIIKRRFNGVQVTVTIPRHIAQAVGMFNAGFVSFQVDEQGRVYILNHVNGATLNGYTQPVDLINRPTEQPAPCNAD